jgi:hypothetical protein
VDRKWRRKPLESHETDSKMAAPEGAVGDVSDKTADQGTVPGLIWSTGSDGEPTHVSQGLLDYSGMRFEDFKHVGWRRSRTRTTFRKLKGLTITQFRPELHTRV